MIGAWTGISYAGPRKMKPRGIIARCELIPGWQVVQCRALYDGSYVWYNCEATGLWQRTYPLSEVNLFLEDYPSLRLHHQLKQQPPLIRNFTQPLPSPTRTPREVQGPLRVIGRHCGLAGPAPRPVWEHTEAPMRLLRLKISLDRPRRPRKRPPRPGPTCGNVPRRRKPLDH